MTTMMMMMVRAPTRKTLHRALSVLTYPDLQGLAMIYGIDVTQHRAHIECALLKQDYPTVARKTLTLLRRAFEEEKP